MGLRALLLLGAPVLVAALLTTPPVPAASGDPLLLVLLDNNRLELRSATGARVGSVSLQRELEPRAPGQYLAVATGGRTAYVLRPPSSSGRTSVVEIDVADRRVASRIVLPAGQVYTALGVGPVSGRLFVFGRRPVKKGGSASAPASAHAVIVDPRTRTMSTHLIRRAAGRDWWIYAVAVSGDERRLMVSYHGTRTTGADLIEVEEDTLRRCDEQSVPHAGCVPEIHGAVEAVAGGFAGTTGELGRVLVVTDSGRAWNVRLPGNHLMGLAYESSRHRIYAFGGCEYAGGLTAIDLPAGKVSVLVRPTSRMCGSRGAASSRALALADWHGIRLLVVDPYTGRVRRDPGLDAKPLDVRWAVG